MKRTDSDAAVADPTGTGSSIAAINTERATRCLMADLRTGVKGAAPAQGPGWVAATYCGDHSRRALAGSVPAMCVLSRSGRDPVRPSRHAACTAFRRPVRRRSPSPNDRTRGPRRLSSPPHIGERGPRANSEGVGQLRSSAVTGSITRKASAPKTASATYSVSRSPPRSSSTGSASPRTSSAPSTSAPGSTTTSTWSSRPARTPAPRR